MDISGLTGVFAYVIYVVLGLIALWGAFCVVMVWFRVGQKRFRSEQAQAEYLEQLDGPLVKADFPGVLAQVEGDQRAMPQLVYLAVANRQLGYAQVRQMVTDRFERDVLADLEYRLNWVYTVIKAAPMVGLLGTVVGMMGAFAKLAAEEIVKPDLLAQDISFALVTTASGLAIAIPLVFCTAAINVRIRRMEDLVAAGLTQFFERFRRALGLAESQGGK
jgi:biopolymer transport protein ExbB/TolQ